jgi:hypothetical protein
MFLKRASMIRKKDKEERKKKDRSYPLKEVCGHEKGLLWRTGRRVLLVVVFVVIVVLLRGGVRSMRALGPTMTARGHSIGISIAMLPQTLIMSRLDQLSRLGARI